MIVPSFTYRVDAFGRVQGHDQDGKPTRPAHVFVDGVQRPQAWLGHFALPERDLLRVAAAILDLDRLTLRRPLNTKGPKVLWRRAINAVIAVEDPSRWSAVSGDLHALLALLTDDSWTLTFEQAEPFHEQRLLFATDLDGSAEIALFSGGLDSSVGLRARHLQSGGSFVAVSAVGNEVRRRVQDAGGRVRVSRRRPVPHRNARRSDRPRSKRPGCFQRPNWGRDLPRCGTLSDRRDVPPIRRGDSALSKCRTSQTSTSSRAPRKGGGS